MLRHCQLYIKALLSYSLKMASRKPKRVAAMFFYLIIFDIRKLLDYKFIYFINHV